MGMRICALYIKKEQLSISDVKQMLVPIYGKVDKVMDKYDPKIRHKVKKGFSINLFSHGIILWDQDLALDTLTKRDEDKIKLLYESFGEPEEMIVFMHFDSGDSFGFSYILNGQIRRYRYSMSNEIGHQEYGEPLPEEKVITDATIFKLEDGDEQYYRLDDLENPCSYHFICSELANEVMKARIGLTMYDDEIWRSSKLFVWMKPDLSKHKEEPLPTKEQEERKGLFRMLKSLFKRHNT